MSQLATIEDLKKEFKQQSALSNISFVLNGKEVYLENEVWGLRSIKRLIPILEGFDITFCVINDKRLLLYKTPITIGDIKTTTDK